MVDSTLTRLRQKFIRRSSASNSVKPSKGTAPSSIADSDLHYQAASVPTTPLERGRPITSESLPALDRSLSPGARQRLTKLTKTPPPSENLSLDTSPLQRQAQQDVIDYPEVKVVAPTPEASTKPTTAHPKNEINVIEEEFQDAVEDLNTRPRSSGGKEISESAATHPDRPAVPLRRQSLVPASQSRLIKTLLEQDQPTARSLPLDYFSSNIFPTDSGMITRKVWVKRPGQSATLVTVAEDDLVDDVRDVILRKYANSLGKSFDSPDVSLKIVVRHPPNTRHPSNERPLGPEEPVGRTLDAHFPNGQTVDDALIIDVPQRRTPKPSPRHGYHMPYYVEDGLRPGEGNEYFPPMNASPNLINHSVSGTSSHHPPSLHSMSVLTTGQLPPLPSPGAARSSKHGRPKYGRTHTSSPTVLTSIPSSQNQPLIGMQVPHPVSSSRSTIDQLVSVIDPKIALNHGAVPAAPPLPTPPAPEHNPIQAPGRVASPRPGQKSKKEKKKNMNPSAPNGRSPLTKPASAGLLDGSIPPINVLVVEDNVINMRLLEAFMKRLKVRWKGAKDGREAVSMWKTGGFHLVLMDIQLPIMSGLEATKEIRRLEKVHDIGAFSSPINEEATPLPKVNGNLNSQGTENGEKVNERTKDTGEQLNLIKSPVIIVALTASSLQSDRHEALAAGCNDFLTKPVNFVWLERKVTEWGCMQALIDFDGWRQWKDIMPKRSDITSPSSVPGEGKPKAIKGIKGVSAAKKSAKDPIPREVDEGPNATGRRTNVREHSVNDNSTGATNNPSGGGSNTRLKRPSGGRKKGSNEVDGITE